MAIDLKNKKEDKIETKPQPRFTEEQIKEMREAFKDWKEDWDDPALDVYDKKYRNKTS